MTYRKCILFWAGVCIGLSAMAQSPVYFTGYGRALVGKSLYDKKSNFVKDDTTSKKQSLDGNFVFDLGVNVKTSDQFKANAILRFYNAFGNFFGSGSVMEFRQVQIQTVLAKKVLFELGDLDMGLTKYTLYNNNEPTSSEFEAEPFKIRRDIVHYENFNNGNKWRLQGAQASSNINFNKGIQKISLTAMGARTIASDYLTTPDRLFFGGQARVKQSKYFEIGGNVASLADIAGTVRDTLVSYDNTVLSGDFKASYTTRTLNFGVYGETGRSFYDFSKTATKERVKKFDGYMDVNASVAHRYVPFSFNIGYRLVGPDFTSPGAQTMRVLDYQNPILLPTGGSPAGTIMDRQSMTFDRMSDLNVYNRSLSAVLMTFNPVYNNATPYGVATPNRQGVSTDLKYGNKDSLVYVNVHAELLSEVLGVGLSDKRRFTLIQPGVTVNLNQLYGGKRMLALSGAMRYEDTKGSNATGIDFTSTMIDGSLTVETLKGLDITGGLKMLQASGKELLAVRDDFNRIASYTLVEPNVEQMVYAAGIRYRFTKYIYLAANAFMLENLNKSNTVENYKMNQYFFSYIMRF